MDSILAAGDGDRLAEGFKNQVYEKFISQKPQKSNPKAQVQRRPEFIGRHGHNHYRSDDDNNYYFNLASEVIAER